jgi:hypothetical protein
VRPLYKKVALFILSKELKDDSNNRKIGTKKQLEKFVFWGTLHHDL